MARVQGLELLEALDSHELAGVAERGALHGLLEQRIAVTDPLRVRANRFLSDRLDAEDRVIPDVGPSALRAACPPRRAARRAHLPEPRAAQAVRRGRQRGQ